MVVVGIIGLLLMWLVWLLLDLFVLTDFGLFVVVGFDGL